MSEVKWFPILNAGFSIPWSMIAPYEQQAMSNYSQTLAQLAARGGLDPREAYAVVHCKPYWQCQDVTKEDAVEFLQEMMATYEERMQFARISELTARVDELEARIVIDPIGGSDRIDELEQANQFLNHQIQNAESVCASLRHQLEVERSITAANHTTIRAYQDAAVELGIVEKPESFTVGALKEYFADLSLGIAEMQNASEITEKHAVRLDEVWRRLCDHLEKDRNSTLAVNEKLLQEIERLAKQVAELDQECDQWQDVATAQHEKISRLAKPVAWPLVGPKYRCTWCILAAGDTNEACLAAEKYTLEAVREHALRCRHNPVVEALHAFALVAKQVSRGCHCGYDHRCGNCQRIINVLEAVEEVEKEFGDGPRMP